MTIPNSVKNRLERHLNTRIGSKADRLVWADIEGVSKDQRIVTDGKQAHLYALHFLACRSVIGSLIGNTRQYGGTVRTTVSSIKDALCTSEDSDAVTFAISGEAKESSRCDDTLFINPGLSVELRDSGRPYWCMKRAKQITRHMAGNCEVYINDHILYIEDEKGIAALLAGSK
jgi:hypothetical protein